MESKDKDIISLACKNALFLFLGIDVQKFSITFKVLIFASTNFRENFFRDLDDIPEIRENKFLQNFQKLAFFFLQNLQNKLIAKFAKTSETSIWTPEVIMNKK